MQFKYLKDEELIQAIPENTLELRGIKNYLTRHPENYMFDPLYKNKLWDGKRTTFNKTNNTFPLGLWQEAMKCCAEFVYPVQFINKKEFPLNRDINRDTFDTFVNAFFDGFIINGNKYETRPYQVDTAYQILKNRYCNIAVATSGGKTFIYALVLFYLLKNNPDKTFLLVVPSKTLVTQFYNDLIEYNWNNELDINIQEIFGIDEKPRTQDPTREPNLVIATFQSLAYMDKVPPKKPGGKETTTARYKKEWFKQFYSVTVDEAHRSSAKSYTKKILQNTLNNAYYRWGMSGTFPKTESYEMMEIMSNTGPIVATVKAKTLMDGDYITKVKIKCIHMNHNDYEFRDLLEIVASKDKKNAYDLECAKIQESQSRIELICKITKECKDPTLILFHNSDYGKILFNHLSENIPEHDFYYIDGKINNKNRSEIKKAMMDFTPRQTKYTILNFGDYSIEVESNYQIKLSNQTYKDAHDITIDDDIDDEFIKTIKKI